MKPAVTSIWFSKSVSPLRGLWFTDYIQSASPGPHPGYVSTPFYTKVIDLDQDQAALQKGLSASTRNVVNRAAREGIRFAESKDLVAFASFFNRFAAQKGLDYRVDSGTLARTCPDYTIVQALHEERVLVMHLFLCDRMNRRVRCLYGGSLLRDAGAAALYKLVSMANRAAHFHEILLFKERGFATFDFGGYAYNTTDPELQRINQFKDSFGGRLVCETNHRSLPLYWAARYLNRHRASVRHVPAITSRRAA